MPEAEALKILRDNCGGTAIGTIKTTKWLLKITKAVDKVQADHRRVAVTQIVHDRLLAVSIRLSRFNDEERRVLIDQWERVTFRIFGMCRKDARTRVGEYVRLAHDVHLRKLGKRALLSELKELGAGNFVIKQAVKGLREADCYNSWQEELRYFMFRYEEHLAADANQIFSNQQWERIWSDKATRSIEHIHPQTPSAGGPWRGALGMVRGQLKKHVHRLGNLLLLPPGLNAKLGNQGFPKKKKEDRQIGLFVAQKVAKKHKWTKKEIEARERALLRFASVAWADI